MVFASNKGMKQQSSIIWFKGFQAQLTNKTDMLYGGLFYEVIMLEGPNKGRVYHVVKPKIPVRSINP